MGLQRFLVQRDSICRHRGQSCLRRSERATAGQQDSVQFTTTGGYAIVVSRLLRPQQGIKDTIPSLYFIRARGVDSTSKLRGNDTTTSTRAVGLIVQWSTITMNVTGAWTSLSGLNKQGSAGQIDGNDQCGHKTAVAGIMVPKGDYSESGNFMPTGNPPLDTSKTLAQLEPMVTIDWNAIVNRQCNAGGLHGPTGCLSRTPPGLPQIRVVGP